MSVLLAKANGAVSSSTTWSVADTTSFQTQVSQTGNVNFLSGTASVQGASFTPGAITVDGIGLYANIAFSGTGTLTARLYNVSGSAIVTGTVISLGFSDFPNNNSTTNSQIGWIFFKFPVPITLLASTVYAVQVVGGGTGTGSLSFVCASGSSTNICRYLRTTTAQAPATSGDTLIITGERTGVGVNNTFTVSIDTTSATNTVASLDIMDGCTFSTYIVTSTAYYFKVNGTIWFHLRSNMTLGTSVAPMPSTSSVTLDISTGSGNQILLDDLVTVQTYGSIKTGATYLSADVAATATTFSVTDTTGWLVGDTVVLSSSTVNWSDYETKVITGISGLTITCAALTKAHTGTAPYICEVLNLTRNVVFKSNTSSSNFRTNYGTTGDYTYTEWNIFGSNAGGGLQVYGGITGTHSNFTNCSFHDFGSSSSIQLGFGQFDGYPCTGINFQHCVIYNVSQGFTSSKSTTAGLVINYVYMILTGSGANGIAVQTLDFTMTNCTISSCQSNAFQFGQNTGNAPATGTFGNLTAHSCGGNGVYISNNMGLLSNVTMWRTTGLTIYSAYFANNSNYMILDTWNLYANQTGQIQFSGGINYPFIIRNCIINGGSGSGQAASGIFLQNQALRSVAFENCTFLNHTSADIYYNSVNTTNISFNNCIFSSTNLIHNPQNMLGGLSFMRFGQVNGVHKAVTNSGTYSTDTVIKHAGTKSLRMTPNQLQYQTTIFSFLVACLSGDTPTISVWVRKSVVTDAGGIAYAGTAPRLVILKDPTNNYANETILAVSVAANGTWEQLSYTMTPIPQNSVLVFAVDCGATAGWANVDDFGVSNPSRDTTNLNYFNGAQPTTLLGNVSLPQYVPTRQRKGM
jgi:hypothetical protein